MATSYLRQIQALRPWHEWSGQQLDWLHDRIAQSDMSDPNAATAQSHPAERRASGGGFLLVLGSILLVLAAIAFVAFAWEALGPIGQVVILFLIGAGCLESAIPLSRRLPGTATAVGIVGALVVAVATVATRFEGGGAVSVGASLLLSVVAAVALALWGVRASRSAPEIAGVGQLTGGLGAFLTLGLVVFAPVDDAVPFDRVSAWVATTLTIGALLLLATARHVGINGGMKLWPPLAAVSLAGAALAWADFVSSLVTWQNVGSDQLSTASVLVLSSLVVVALSLVFRDYVKLLLGLALGMFAFAMVLTLVTGLDVVESRPWASLLLFVGAVLFACVARGRTLAAASRTHAIYSPVVCLIAAAAAGLAVTPWNALPRIGEPRTVPVWVQDAWPVWRGALSGLAFVAVMLAATYFVQRVTTDTSAGTRKSSLPVFAMLTGIAVWTLAIVQDLATVELIPLGTSRYEAAQSSLLLSIGVGLAIPGLALLLFAGFRRTDTWTVWIGAAFLVVSAFLFVQPTDINATLRPELVALMLATPTAVAGFLWWRLHLPESTPTWISVGPAVTLAFAPSTLALAVDSLERWAAVVDPSPAYQVRFAALLAVATALTIWGARSRLGGLFYPGTFVLLIIAVIGVVDLGRFLPQWVSFAIAGAALLAAGAKWESMRRFGQQQARWVSALH